VISEEEFIQRGVAARLMHLGICSSACGLLLLPPDAVLYLWRVKHEYGSGKIFLLLLILCGLWLAGWLLSAWVHFVMQYSRVFQVMNQAPSRSVMERIESRELNLKYEKR
jgi:hypothetical protein